MRTKRNTLRQNRRAFASMLTKGRLSYKCSKGSIFAPFDADLDDRTQAEGACGPAFRFPQKHG
jgi:hypothetical protein